MARGIDEVQLIGLPIEGGIGQRDRLRLDGDATFTLNRIGVQHLRFHLAFGEATANLDDAVCQSRFAVIDVGNDRKITNVLHVAAKSPNPWLKTLSAIMPERCLGRSFSVELADG